MGCSVSPKTLENENKPEISESKNQKNEITACTNKSTPIQKSYLIRKNEMSNKGSQITMNLKLVDEKDSFCFEKLNLNDNDFGRKAIPDYVLNVDNKPKIVFLDVNKYINLVEIYRVQCKILA